MPKIKITEPLIRWTGIPLVAFLPYYFMDHHEHMAGGYWTQYLISLAFTTVYWNGATFIFFQFRKIFPEISKTTIRLIFTYICLVLWMSVGGIPLKLFFGFTEWNELVTWDAHKDIMPFNLMIGFLVGTFYETSYFFTNWKRTFQLNEQLKSQQIKTQFEVLQNQMSPHFLFNSLNTLTTLIAENQEVAIDFTQKLSEVYRYILQNKERELVTISEELEFAKSYFFLLKMRYPENLELNFNIDPKFHHKHIAPLTLQMLIENAIKHNVVSKAHPLHIDVYIENDQSIIVKNNLQPKMTLERSTKTGLQNIQKRYQLLGYQNVDIISTAKNFMVAIPLIKLIRDSDLNTPASA